MALILREPPASAPKRESEYSSFGGQWSELEIHQMVWSDLASPVCADPVSIIISEALTIVLVGSLSTFRFP